MLISRRCNNSKVWGPRPAKPTGAPSDTQAESLAAAERLDVIGRPYHIRRFGRTRCHFEVTCLALSRKETKCLEAQFRKTQQEDLPLHITMLSFHRQVEGFRCTTGTLGRGSVEPLRYKKHSWSELLEIQPGNKSQRRNMLNSEH